MKLIPAEFGLLIECESDARKVAATMIRRAATDEAFVRALAAHEGVPQYALAARLAQVEPRAVTPDTIQSIVRLHIDVAGVSMRRSTRIYFHIPFDAMSDEAAFASWRRKEANGYDGERLNALVNAEVRARLHKRAMERLGANDRAAVVRRADAAEKASAK